MRPNFLKKDTKQSNKEPVNTKESYSVETKINVTVPSIGSCFCTGKARKEANHESIQEAIKDITPNRKKDSQNLDNQVVPYHSDANQMKNDIEFLKDVVMQQKIAMSRLIEIAAKTSNIARANKGDLDSYHQDLMRQIEFSTSSESGILQITGENTTHLNL